MSRRSFRYDAALDRMVEINRDLNEEYHYVRDDIPPFVSPITGTVVEGRRAYENHCRQHNVVPTADLAGNTRSVSVVAQERERRQLREQLWEYTNKSMRGRKCRD
ncbi:MAG TPA: hypothetical protein VNN06_10895 [Ramlibacter sp.]|jgi:hypothetical protein|nr:hypothetical protein [Ramlibacter sp.]